MKFMTISLYASLCILLISCKKATPSTNEKSNCSMDSLERNIEAICLNSKNNSMTFSMNTTTENMINDYKYRYLGSLQVNSRRFDVIQETVLSGQYKDSQRAIVSIRLFTDGKYYGEYVGLNNFYSVKISSNNICIYNAETKSSAKFNMKDSIPKLLFFPYDNKNRSSSGDLFYFNKK